MTEPSNPPGPSTGPSPEPPPESSPEPPAGPSRRLLLGAAGALGAGAALGTAAPAGAAPPDGRAPFSTAPAAAALRRLLGDHAAQFRLTPLTGGRERFEVGGAAGRIEVAGTSPAVLLTGVHWYLKYGCRAHLTWNARQLDLPRTLPAPPRGLNRSTGLRHRFALNDTNDGYTSPYADWAYWERMIDILALHGCNEVLVIAGHEAVYHRLWQGFGYSEAESRAWLPAPSHQPWWLLQNLSGYGGPLTPDLISRRAALGRRIADRLRELGMAPVLPGYYGSVPDGFTARNPGAAVVPQGMWHGFRRPDWLDPRTAAFPRVAAAYYRHQAELLGEAAHFKMDLLHEGGTAGGVPVAAAAKGVERALRTAHPDATWVILGWQDNPLPELLNAVDRKRMLIVDGISERFKGITDREKDWGGTPYAFGTIPNFGGRTTIGAKTHLWTEKFFAWRDKPDSALVGTAYMPEAADRDPAAFEFFSELAWQDRAPDRAGWFGAYAAFRYGREDPAARGAWTALCETAYRQEAPERSDPHDSLFAARPDLAADRAGEYAPSALSYDPARFDAALAGLLAAGAPLRATDTYRFDLVDVARQALAHRSRQLLPELRSAYERKDLAAFRTLAALWLRLMRLADDIAGTHREFLVGPWNAAARAWATGTAQATELERTARILITVWGGRATSDDGKLHDYANRDWHGLMGDFYMPRWRRWLEALEDALREGRAPRPVDWYTVEEPWTRETKEYPLRPVGDAHRTALRVRDALATAPYQGALSASALPTAVAPGGTTTVTVSLANVNGLRGTGRVDLALAGLTATPQGATSLPRLAPGATGSARWRVTAPAAPLERPLQRLPYEVSAVYGPQGEDRVRSVRSGTLFLAGPLGSGWHTATDNAAVFGRLGEDRFAIDGAGEDLWKGTEQFGTVYRAGALAVRAVASVRVDAQTDTGSWARSGIIVRNGLAGRSPGAVNLAVTPGQGVVVSYDSNGDGTFDAYRRITGIKAPVHLRLTRAGTDLYRAECSTDEGATWRPVAEVRVPGTAARQDVGMFLTAGNDGSGERGTAEFSGWRLT
ncbi:alpha-N-acetylglucosaminidase [Streptomyces eurocidicus]|uniref:Alpha-N-acetylglucosaminidase n=1 Tax=Streptomyces eurocidicus TaxID=66423 RepID=A0A7W8F240_STREU|nr:alpha-N-acetylglucosaminidase TIM-barrel domain-containing protein [Streptomyces eurocidicus]MBB5118654.1 alpha-N-acetylglucosaminidase [Streptomyces eurocidicus]MBF6056272.1 alpha-N-acetylglucosaminidase [Streptomyces eurocidicus]